MRHHVATPLDDILEKDLQAQVFQLAELLGWKRGYHTHDSRRSTPGFPDVVLVRDRVLFLELKRERRVATPLTATQKEWLCALAAAGAEVYLVRPHNIAQLAAVLGARRSTTTYLTTASATEARNGLLAELEREIAA